MDISSLYFRFISKTHKIQNILLLNEWKRRLREVAKKVPFKKCWEWSRSPYSLIDYYLDSKIEITNKATIRLFEFLRQKINIRRIVNMYYNFRFHWFSDSNTIVCFAIRWCHLSNYFICCWEVSFHQWYLWRQVHWEGSFKCDLWTVIFIHSYKLKKFT